MYVRDKRSPVPKNEAVSRVMSANRAKIAPLLPEEGWQRFADGVAGVPELQLRKALWHAGLKGYRLHHEPIPGRPDISFVGKKLAIFVHGCFWHRCPRCNYGMPKNNSEYWRIKFERNIARDEKHRIELGRQG